VCVIPIPGHGQPGPDSLTRPGLKIPGLAGPSLHAEPGSGQNIEPDGWAGLWTKNAILGVVRPGRASRALGRARPQFCGPTVGSAGLGPRFPALGFFRPGPSFAQVWLNRAPEGKYILGEPVTRGRVEIYCTTHVVVRTHARTFAGRYHLVCIALRS
jgi:hypothetical protein